MKTAFFRIFYLLAFIVVLVNAVFLVKTNLLPDIENLPAGKQMETIDAPDGSVQLHVYQVKNAIGSAIRISVTDLTNGRTRNLYWQTGKDKVTVVWKDSNEVLVDEMPLNVKLGGYYDCRRGYSILSPGSLFNAEE